MLPEGRTNIQGLLREIKVMPSSCKRLDFALSEKNNNKNNFFFDRQIVQGKSFPRNGKN